MSPLFRPAAVAISIACAAAIAAACGTFGSDGATKEPLDSADSAATDGGSNDGGSNDGSALDGTATDGPSTPAVIRCGNIACPATMKCCLPLDTEDAGCVDRNAVCAAGFGELLCSDPTPCQPAETCCVTVERNGGQNAFDITRSFCAPASACPDQRLQHSMCDLGATGQCPGRACKPFVHDVNDAGQDLGINPTGYATCQ